MAVMMVGTMVVWLAELKVGTKASLKVMMTVVN
jgi:hypothetical protein